MYLVTLKVRNQQTRVKMRWNAKEIWLFDSYSLYWWFHWLSNIWAHSNQLNFSMMVRTEVKCRCDLGLIIFSYKYIRSSSSYQIQSCSVWHRWLVYYVHVNKKKTERQWGHLILRSGSTRRSWKSLLRNSSGSDRQTEEEAAWQHSSVWSHKQPAANRKGLHEESTHTFLLIGETRVTIRSLQQSSQGHRLTGAHVAEPWKHTSEHILQESHRPQMWPVTQNWEKTQNKTKKPTGNYSNLPVTGGYMLWFWCYSLSRCFWQ